MIITTNNVGLIINTTNNGQYYTNLNTKAVWISKTNVDNQQRFGLIINITTMKKQQWLILQ